MNLEEVLFLRAHIRETSADAHVRLDAFRKELVAVIRALMRCTFAATTAANENTRQEKDGSDLNVCGVCVTDVRCNRVDGVTHF